MVTYPSVSGLPISEDVGGQEIETVEVRAEFQLRLADRYIGKAMAVAEAARLARETPESRHGFRKGQRVMVAHQGPGTVVGGIVGCIYVVLDSGLRGCGALGEWMCPPADLTPLEEEQPEKPTPEFKVGDRVCHLLGERPYTGVIMQISDLLSIRRDDNVPGSGENDLWTIRPYRVTPYDPKNRQHAEARWPGAEVGNCGHFTKCKRCGGAANNRHKWPTLDGRYYCPECWDK